MKLICPACGAEVQFKSRSSVFGVCTYCTSMIVRHDMNLETLGKMANLPPDMSPLQISTRGRFNAVGFEIVGRLKVNWENGNWNEWYVLFDDGRSGWLADAQGFYMVSFQVQDIRNIPNAKQIAVGHKLILPDGHSYEVEDIKEVVCVGSEGELPFNGPKGRKSISVDLTGPKSEFACIDYAQDGTRLYMGKYVELEQLKLTSLREIDGW